MARTYTERKKIRKSFARIPEIAPLPNLIELQTTSYQNFLQMDVPAENRASTGLQEVFKSVFPISDFSGKSHSSGNYFLSARVIPYRGSWLDFEFDAKDIVYARIDRKRKLLLSTLRMAIDSDETEKKRKIAAEKGEKLDPLDAQGMSREEILNEFYGTVDYQKSGEHWKTAFRPDLVKPAK